ncbi:16993_t:CDS:2, partial [Racocetra fulgida]
IDIIKPNIYETIQDDILELQHIQEAIHDDMTEFHTQETVQVDISFANSYDEVTAEICYFINQEAVQNFSDQIWQGIETCTAGSTACIDNTYSNKENEPIQIKNPSVSRRKERPETKRYKSLLEK